MNVHPAGPPRLLARGVARLLHRVRIARSEDAALSALSADATVVFVMNHRSNMDPGVRCLSRGDRDRAGADVRRMRLIVVVMTVHSFAEGVAVGAAFGGGAELATVITIAIAVHNVPEGLAISAVLRPRGVSLAACAGWSVFSSLPQPLMAVPAFLFVEAFRPALPWGLGFAAGAMVFMVFVELLPEAYEDAPRPAIGLLATLTLVAMLLFQRYL